MKRIIECVPNYSEGRDKSVIDAIVAAISAVEGVKVLDVDPGEATNRTVVTFVGEPEPVVEAAFRGAAKAQELIDMRQHHGAHPRSGATDVLPLIPVSGITLEECATLARGLAERLYKELGIPCYCYEAAAFKPERRNLAVCRAGEYEALPEKMADPDRKPDFGGAYDEVAARAGATNVGARNFLIAVNYNLNTTSTRRAMAVAFDVREKGRKAREGGSLTGKLLKDEKGEQIWIPGTLKGCKAIGWYIDEYGIAVKSMSLDDLKPFNPKEKVIEYLMEDEAELAVREKLVRMSVKGFAAETASESPAPGGGSISAYMGALGAALATMVANLSSHKRGWDDRWKEFSDVAEKGQALMAELLALVDEDTAAFNRIMDCFSMPKGTPEEKAARAAALEEATLYAASVPLKTMEAALKALPRHRPPMRASRPSPPSPASAAPPSTSASTPPASRTKRPPNRS